MNDTRRNFYTMAGVTHDARRRPRRVTGSLNVAALLFLALASLGASGENDTALSPPLSVYTVNYPLQYFAARIAGDRAQVIFPAPRDIDPAFWRPSADIVVAYQNADLIVLNGAGYARWRGLASLPRSRLLDTSAGFRAAMITGGAASAHRHGPAGDHDHGGTAFTTWLDFAQAASQASAVADDLKRLAPAAGPMFATNSAALNRDLGDLDRAVAASARRDPERRWLASHPVYQYFARRYGLAVEALTWEPDTFPDAAEWAVLGSVLASYPSRWMLWEAEPLPQTKARLGELGITIVVFDPCFNAPATGDFLTVMRENARRFERSYVDPESGPDLRD